LPEIREKLSPHTNMLCVAELAPKKPGDSDGIRSTSYLLSAPDSQIMKIKPGPGLNAQPLDAVKFINEVVR
jgi:hypothetical protein